MAEDKKVTKKFPNMVTPKGTAKYAWLNKPDVGNAEFKLEPKYKVTLVMPLDTAQPLIDLIEKERVAWVAECQALTPKKKLETIADPPFKYLEDEEGDQTGDVAFHFKMNASYNDKAGVPHPLKPQLVDARGLPLGNGVAIYAGSTIKVSFQINQYNAKAKAIGCGLSLRLQGVQVLKLVSGGADLGFGVEEGYEYSAPPADDVEGDVPGEVANGDY